MTWQFYAFVFGILGAAIALVIGGHFIDHWLGTAMMVVGIIGGIGWLIGIFDVATALNSDR